MQGVLHWVAEPSPGVDPLVVEVRLFEKLFLSEKEFFIIIFYFLYSDIEKEFCFVIIWN
jgi:hypothetical protein